MKETQKRVFLIVLDSVGAGAAPDAADFGDTGAFTLRSVMQTGEWAPDCLRRLGMGNIDGLSFLGTADAPTAAVARMQERSRGKDTTVGHWEIAGHISPAPLPTFPNGFPQELLDRLTRETGREILCNRPYSGTEVIRDYGEEQLRRGALIVYTSADSVFQIAAHTDSVPLEELYDICRKARKMLAGPEYGVGRVIARPFAGKAPDFYRTADRRDFSLEPPHGLLPEAVKNAGLSSVAIGKISDIFAGCGFTDAARTHSNAEVGEELLRWVEKPFAGLCFANFVDFDMLWGHRRDAVGYARGMKAFDRWLPEFLSRMKPDDLLMITADHGCDPCFTATTDHTREYTPLVMVSSRIRPDNFGTRIGFADIAATAAAWLEIGFSGDGKEIPLRLL